MIYLTSDLHFLHTNIIRYCARPYANIEEMTGKLIAGWNSVVTQNDTVYFLGDFTFSNDPIVVDRIFNSLMGKKFLIFGNHETTATLKLPWCGRYDIFDLKYNGMFFVLCHYPFLSWKHSNHGSVNLHGHIHSKVALGTPTVRRIDVGVDAWDYKPVSIDKIVELANTVTTPPQSHHEEIKPC